MSGDLFANAVISVPRIPRYCVEMVTRPHVFVSLLEHIRSATTMPMLCYVSSECSL